MKQKKLLLLSFLIVLLGFSACSAASVTPMNPQEKMAEAKKLLNGEIVLSTRAFMYKTDLTKLPGGAPMKYKFTWRDGDVLDMRLQDFNVGGMPFHIWFAIDLKFVSPDKQDTEHAGEGWLKFAGKGSVTDMREIPEDYKRDPQNKEGEVTGYLNVKTGEIEFKTTFNSIWTIVVNSEVFRQKIDHSRISKYEAEKEQYAKDLKEFKANKGK